MIKLFFSILVMAMSFASGGNGDGEVTYAATRTIPFNDDYSRVVTSLEENERMIVKYDVKEKDIYVECFVKDFTFSKERAGQLKQDGEGHVQLFINGNKVDSIYTSSFIIKALPVGTYTIKIELVHNDYTPYGISKEFEVNL